MRRSAQAVSLRVHVSGIFFTFRDRKIEKGILDNRMPGVDERSNGVLMRTYSRSHLHTQKANYCPTLLFFF